MSKNKAALEWAANVGNIVDRFLGWTPWDARHDIGLPVGKWRAHEYAGVYLFADFGGRRPRAPASYEHSAVFYVGETGRTLGERWYEYRHQIRDAWGRNPDDIYVAALPTWVGRDDTTTPEPLTTQFRLYTERRIIWELTLKHHPLLNLR